MKHIPVKLGPLALVLTVISICMTVLGILSFTTARADLSLARRHGDTVRIRYELEAEGQAFLGEAHRVMESAGGDLAGLLELADTEAGEDGVIRRIISRDSFTLTVGVAPDEADGIRIVDWRIQKEWEPDEEMGNLWSGEE
ncbi:MAG: hypothetical protein HFI42_16295 [Lachnospiraceae bacterium]|nr:hypothetical protein [Lachnospiraceae bacterium]MCI9151998.1 hypothetical protein [Lachnospiraceae bacterium]